MSISYVRVINESLNVGTINFVPDPQLELQLGNYANVSTGNIYGHTVLQPAANWTSVALTPATYTIPLIPAPGISCALSYEQISAVVDNTTEIVIECYENDTDTAITTKVVTLNDINKVTIPGTIYRIVNIYVNPSGPTPTGTGRVYIYDNTLVPVLGVPPDYFDLIRIGGFGQPNFANRRETAIYYSPPGTTTYAHNLQVTTDNDAIEKTLSFEIVLNENHTQHLTFYPGTGIQTYNNPYIEVGPGLTFHIKARAPNTTSGCPLTFSMDLILYTPPT